MWIRDERLLIFDIYRADGRRLDCTSFRQGSVVSPWHIHESQSGEFIPWRKLRVDIYRDVAWWEKNIGERQLIFCREPAQTSRGTSALHERRGDETEAGQKGTVGADAKPSTRARNG